MRTDAPAVRPTQEPEATIPVDTSTPGIFGEGEDADYWRKLEPPDGKGTLIRLESRFVVLLNEKDEVDWESTSEHDLHLREEKIDISGIQGTITILEAVPVTHLPADTRRAFRCILGEAMAAAMEGEGKAAQQLLVRGEAFVTARNSEHARQWYLTGSYGAAALAAASAITIWAVFHHWATTLPEAGVNILAVGLGGSAGSLFSILLRVGKAPLDPSGGKDIHHKEGAARVAVGVIAAAIAVSAIRVQLVFPQLAEGPYGVVLAALAAGSSERMASAIAERVEGLLAKDNTAKGPKRKSN